MAGCGVGALAMERGARCAGSAGAKRGGRACRRRGRGRGASRSRARSRRSRRGGRRRGAGRGRRRCILAIHLDKGVKKGKSFEELIKDIEEFKYKVRSEFTVDDVNFLAKTGRINKVVAKIASALKIKVLLKGSNDSTIVSTAKVPGRKLSIKKLAKQCIDFIKNAKDQIVYITHCNCLKDALDMKKMLAEKNINNVEIYDYDLVTGSHLGPNALAIFYVSDSR